MVRVISFLAAVVVLLSAAAEIASFAIDHQSWLQQNFQAARDYVVAWTKPEQPAPARACEAPCGAAQQAGSRSCATEETMGKKVLCYLTLPRADAKDCTPKDCPPKDKQPLPRDWIRSGKKGDVASGPTPN